MAQNDDSPLDLSSFGTPVDDGPSPFDTFAPSQPVAAKTRSTYGFHPDVESAIDDAAGTHGVDPDLMRTFAKIESSGDPRKRTGSYNGLFMLSADEFKRFGGDADIFDPGANARAAALKFKTEEDDFAKRYGRKPNASELYFLHQQGVGGADAHWRNPEAPAWENMYRTAEGRQKGPDWAKAAIWDNLPDAEKRRFGTVENITSRDFADFWDRRVQRLSGRDDPTRGVQVAQGEAPGGPLVDLSQFGTPVEAEAPLDLTKGAGPDPLIAIREKKDALEQQIRAIRQKMEGSPEMRQSHLPTLEQVGNQWKKLEEQERIAQQSSPDAANARGWLKYIPSVAAQVLFRDWGRLTPGEAKQELRTRLAEAPAEIKKWEDGLKELADYKAGRLKDPERIRALTELEKHSTFLPKYAHLKGHDILEAQYKDYLAEEKLKLKALKDIEAGLKPGFTKTATRAGVENFATGVVDVVASVPKFAGVAASYMGLGTPNPEESQLVQVGEWIQQKTKDLLPGDMARDEQKDFAQQLAQGAGSMIGFMGPGAALRVLGIAGKYGSLGTTLVSGGAAQGVEVFDEATDALRQVKNIKDPRTGKPIKFTPDEQDRLIASGWGFLLGTTEAFPIERALGRPSGRELRKILAAGRVGATEEGLQEGFQTIGGNVVAKNYYDPTRDTFEGAGDAALIGAILGFKMSAGKATIDAWKHRQKLATDEADQQKADVAFAEYLRGALGRGEITERDLKGVRSEVEKARPAFMPQFDAIVNEWKAGDKRVISDAQPDDLEQPGNILAAARTRTGRTTPPALPDEAVPEVLPMTTEEPEATAPPPSPEEMSVLRRMGYTEVDIRDMDPAQRVAEMDDARTRGVVPDAPTAEPISDIVAQARDLADPDNQRTGLYLSPDNVRQIQENPDFIEEIAGALRNKGELVDNVDGNGGVLLAKDAATARAVRAAIESGQDIQQILGQLTGAGQGKSADASAVVQQVTPEGAVTRESAVTQDQIGSTEQQFAAPGRDVRTVTPEDVLARREQGRTTPPPLPGEQAGDGSRQAPVRVETPEDVARAEQRVVEPTDGQKEAGNYSKGHLKFQGLDITIENPKGSIRRGTSPDGTPWEVSMPATYGYVKRSVGRDGDQVDVYVGPNPKSDRVFVIDQVDPDTGKFDEHKAMLGYNTISGARFDYEQAFSDGRAAERMGGITEMTVAKFKDWLAKGKRTRPLSKPDEKPDTGADQPTETPQEQADIYQGEPLTPEEIEDIADAWRTLTTIDQQVAEGKNIADAKLDEANLLSADFYDAFGREHDSFPDEQSLRQYLSGQAQEVEGRLRPDQGEGQEAQAAEAEAPVAEGSGRAGSPEAEVVQREQADRGREGDGAGQRNAELERPKRYEGDNLTDDDIDTIVDQWKYVREVANRPKPESLAAFVIARGGIKDDAREVRQIAGAAKERPGLVNKDGWNLDDISMAAWESGFMGDMAERPTIADFLDRLQDDLHTGTVVRLNDEPLLDDIRIANEIARELADYGVTTNRFRSEATLREYFGQERPSVAGEAARDEEAEPAAEERTGQARPDQDEVVLPPDEAPETGPSDSSEWLADRERRIKASKADGNKHLDDLPRAVEGMRGVAFHNVHDPKERGVVRTVANTGDVVVNWSDKYSADKNLVEDQVQDGKKKVWQSWLMPTDLKDYVVDRQPGQEAIEAPAITTEKSGQTSLVPEATTKEKIAAEAKKKGDRGKSNADLDAGELFNPDAGKQTDLVDMAKAEPRKDNQVSERGQTQDRGEDVGKVKAQTQAEAELESLIDDVITKQFARKGKETTGPLKIGSGDILRSQSGREMSPAPKIDATTSGRATNSIKRMNAWLHSEAIKEVDARPDGRRDILGNDAEKEYLRTILEGIDPKKATQSDQDTLNDIVFGSPEGATEDNLVRRHGEKPSARKAAKAAGSAARNVIKGMGEVATGLATLFGAKSNRVGSGPSFDEDTYRKAVPFFKSGISHFSKAGSDIKTAVRELVSYLADTAGMSKNTILDMKPYLVRFVRDIQTGVIDPAKGDENAPDSRQGVERDREAGRSEDSLGQARIPDERVQDGAGAQPGDGQTGEKQPPARGGSVPDGDAPAVGTGRDRGVPGRASRDERGPAGSDSRGRGSDAGVEGVPAGRVATEEVSNTARRAPALRDALAAQREADAKVPFKLNDPENIREALPALKPAQQDDVVKAEARFSQPEGHGFLFTNGTGTGKTWTGLGVVKRFVKQGKSNILVLAPSQGILDGWVTTGRMLGVDITRLPDTKTAGTGIVATTYANLRDNAELAKRDFDLIVADESHNLSQEQSGNPTAALRAFRALAGTAPAHRASMLLAEAAEEVEAAKKEQKVIAARRNLPGNEGTVEKGLARIRELEQAYFQRHTEMTKELSTRPRAKALFLSATPFAYRKSTDYAEGFLFDYPETTGRYNAPGGQAEFLQRNFGYAIRYNRAEEPGPEVNVGVLEREFYERLKREGVLSGRRLEVEADYDRRFVLVDDAVGAKIDQAMTWLSTEGKGRYLPLFEEIHETFNYLAQRRLLEAIKAKHVIPRIKRDIELGRKVVVFHDYNEGGGFAPFAPPKNPNRRVRPAYGEKEGPMIGELYSEFIKANPYVKTLDFAQFKSPIETLTTAFPEALLYNGRIPNKQRSRARDEFNLDGSGRDIIIVQSAAGEAGISLHDTTGKHQRVLYNLGLPTRPTTAIQQEGRIYREGQVSDAILRYMSTGTGWERTAFSQTIAERASTAENLALGDEARALRDSFIDSFNDADDIPQGADEGRGGKVKDRTMAGAVSPYEKAKAFYFGEGKKRGRRDQREGTDYYATPEPIGLKMVEFADVQIGERILEPSAGHGAIARWFPEGANRVLIEPSSNLASRAGLASPGAKIITSRFEDHYIGNKYDAIVMNPPFGAGGKDAIDHIQKAVGHLREGGRVVAILPRGPAADKRLEAFRDNETNKNIYAALEVDLPPVMFERAGTKVATRLVVFERHSEPSTAPQTAYRDLSDAETINELFDRMENLSLSARKRENQSPAGQVPADVVESPRQTVAPATAEVSFKLGETKHSRTGANLYVASIAKQVPRATFDNIMAAAKKHKGYYSSFRGSGAIPGFQFPTEEDRTAFLRAITSVDARSVADQPRPSRTISQYDYVKGRLMLRQPVDLSQDAERILDIMRETPSALPGMIPEAVATKLTPIRGTDKYRVTALDLYGEEHAYEDDAAKIIRTQGHYLLAHGRPLVVLSPIDFGGDLVKTTRTVRAHETVHALRLNGFLPGGNRDLGTTWGRLVGHADVLGVLHMSRHDLYKRLGDPKQETASKTTSTFEVYTTLYGSLDNTTALELYHQEAVAHMMEVYVAGGWTDQEIAPVKDILDDILSGKTAQWSDVSEMPLSAGMLRSIRDSDETGPVGTDNVNSLQDTITGQSMRRDLDSLGFYSKAIEAARALKQEKGTPEQMLAQLKKAGVKDAEIEATGLADLFKKAGSTTALESDAITLSQNPQQQGDRTASPPRRARLNQITKADIVKHLEKNRVGLREVVRTPEGYDDIRAIYGRNRDIQQQAIADARNDAALSRVAREPDEAQFLMALGRIATGGPPSRLTDIRGTRRAEYDAARRHVAAIRAARELAQTQTGELGRAQERTTKWEQHSLDPSNPTYRETVIHLPGKGGPELIPNTAGDWGNTGGAGGMMRNPEFDRQNVVMGHFPEPNIIGHMMTSMTRHEGKPVYTIDQIQSDWGQKLRDGGVRDEAKIAELKAKRAEHQAAFEKIIADDVVPFFKEHGASPPRFPTHAIADLRALARDMSSRAQVGAKALGLRLERAHQPIDLIDAEIRTAEASSPGHPLVNTTDQWTQTTLRRAIRQAVEAGAEYIAIPHGDTVLSYNPGDRSGMRGFYGGKANSAEADAIDAAKHAPEDIERDRADAASLRKDIEGIVPKNLRKLLKAIDPASPVPQRINTLETPSGMKGEGFTLFPLTDNIRQSVLEEGQPMFSAIPSAQVAQKVADVHRDISEAINIVQRIAGPAVDIDFKSEIPIAGWATPQIEGVRAAGIDARTAGGTYRRPSLNARAVIALATNDPNHDLLTTAGHEAFHHVEEILASEAEKRIIRHPDEMRRMQRLAGAEIGMAESDPRLARLPEKEIRAIAFQRYRKMREEGLQNASRLHIATRRFWDRLIRIFQGVRNAMKGRGFDSFEAIFERARTGEMVATAAERRIDATATPAPRVGLSRQMTASGYVEREPFDLANVREVGRSMASVPISDIRTVQKSVGISSTKAKLRNPSSDGPISLFKFGGRYYVNDGNHRIEAARALGAKSIRAEVIELEGKDAVSPAVLEDRGSADVSTERVGAEAVAENASDQEVMASAISRDNQGIPSTPGLDMSKEARLERAREMGFDTSRVWYHGTVQAGFGAFEIDASRSSSRNNGFAGVSVSQYPMYANEYTGTWVNTVTRPTERQSIAARIGLRPRQVETVREGASIPQASSPGVYPLYLRVSRPFVWNTDDFNSVNNDTLERLSRYFPGYSENNFPVKQRRAISDALRAAGYDAIDIINDGALVERVIFDPSNIRSVNAAFDPAHSDSSELMASLIPAAAKTAAQGWLKTNVQPHTDNIRRYIQDKMLYERRQEEAIEARQGIRLPIDMSAYVAESLYHGRGGERLMDFEKNRFKPLADHLRKNNISFDELGDYVYALHAEERNDAIRAFDPTNDSGSGMTDAEARGIIGMVQQGSRAAAFKQASRMIQTMVQEARDTLYRSGNLTQQQYNNWNTKYKNYVALRGHEGDIEEDGIPNVGRGMDIRGPESMQALGRRSKADNPVLYVLQQSAQAIIRSEKNRVDRTLYRLIQSHPDPDVWRIYRGEARRRINPQTGLLETYWVAPPFAVNGKNRDQIFGVKIGGKQHYMWLNKDLARAFRTPQAGVIWGTSVGRGFFKLARLYAQLVTQFSPEFVATNYLRDIPTSLVNASDIRNKPDGVRRKILSEALSLKNIRGIMAALQEHEGYTVFGTKRAADENMLGMKRRVLAKDIVIPGLANPQSIPDMFNEYRLAGGKISFIEMNDIDQIRTRMEKSLRQGSAMRAMRGAFELVDNANSAVENGVRLSVYIAMRKNGSSQEEAATAARELTVNFNRKGEMGPAMNALYLFSNASAQGTIRIAQAMVRSPGARKAAGAIVLAGFLLDLYNYMAAGIDDDDENAYEKIEDWKKEKNMIFMLPGRKDYQQIPMPYGYNVFHIFGTKIAALMRTAAGAGKEKPAKAISALLGAMVESFSPLGASPSWVQTVSPTLLDPFVQIAENKKWFGGKIGPDKLPNQKHKPDSEMFFSTAPGWAIDLARDLNKITGGSKVEAGYIDISPETIEHIADFLMGGVGKLIGNTIATAERAYRGQEWIPEKTPFVRRLYGKATSESRRRDFYEKWNEVDKIHYQFKTYQDSKEFDQMRRVRAENLAEITAYESMRIAQKQISGLRKQGDVINLNRELDAVEKEKRLKILMERENVIILRALKNYNKLKQKQSPNTKPNEDQQ